MKKFIKKENYDRKRLLKQTEKFIFIESNKKYHIFKRIGSYIPNLKSR